MLKALPTSYPSREADAVTTAFIADIHSRLPALCGTALRYSSKSFTPTVGLLPLTAIGAEATSRAVNLQPRSQPPKPTPKANLRYYPTSPTSKLSSQPAHAGAHVASLPTHSAALGPQSSKPPPKKKIKFDAPASDSIRSQNVSTTLGQAEYTATRTAGASMRPGPASAISKSDNATSIQPRQSTTAPLAKDGIVNVPGSKKAALNSSEFSRKATCTVPSVGDAARNRVSPVARYMYRSHFGVCRPLLTFAIILLYRHQALSVAFKGLPLPNISYTSSFCLLVNQRHPFSSCHTGSLLY